MNVVLMWSEDVPITLLFVQTAQKYSIIDERKYTFGGKPNPGQEILIRMSKTWSMKNTSGNTLDGQTTEMCNTYIHMKQNVVKNMSHVAAMALHESNFT